MNMLKLIKQDGGCRHLLCPETILLTILSYAQQTEIYNMFDSHTDSKQTQKINKKYKNEELEERIQSISQAVKSFDVETLKTIYDKCSGILK